MVRFYSAGRIKCFIQDSLENKRPTRAEILNSSLSIKERNVIPPPKPNFTWTGNTTAGIGRPFKFPVNRIIGGWFWIGCYSSHQRVSPYRKVLSSWFQPWPRLWPDRHLRKCMQQTIQQSRAERIGLGSRRLTDASLSACISNSHHRDGLLRTAQSIPIHSTVQYT